MQKCSTLKVEKHQFVSTTNKNMKSVCKMLNVEESNKTKPKRNTRFLPCINAYTIQYIDWSKEKKKKIFQCNLIIVIFTLGSLNSTCVQYQKQIVFIQRAYALFSCRYETFFPSLVFVCYRMACKHTYFQYGLHICLKYISITLHVFAIDVPATSVVGCSVGSFLFSLCPLSLWLYSALLYITTFNIDVSTRL